MKIRLLWVLSLALVIVSPAGWLTKAQTQSQTESKPVTGMPQPSSEAPSCPGGPPKMTFLEAREAFVKQGRVIRGAGKVITPHDLVGGIMILTTFSSWFYVTDVEFRYDESRSALAYARLEGYLADGTPWREDKTKQLPASFRVVNRLADVGSVMFVLGGKAQKVQSIGYSITKMGMTVVGPRCDWCEVIEPEPDPGGGGGGSPCRMTASGNCNAIFCTQYCNTGCSCPGWGFCYSIPGGSCQGSCPDDRPTCHVVAPNPGQFFCACIE